MTMFWCGFVIGVLLTLGACCFVAWYANNNFTPFR